MERLGVVILGVAPDPPKVLGAVVAGDVCKTSEALPELVLLMVAGFAVLGVPPVAGGVMIVAPEGVTVVTLPNGAVTVPVGD
jgi:hypothetical protein